MADGSPCERTGRGTRQEAEEGCAGIHDRISFGRVMKVFSSNSFLKLCRSREAKSDDGDAENERPNLNE